MLLDIDFYLKFNLILKIDQKEFHKKTKKKSIKAGKVFQKTFGNPEIKLSNLFYYFYEKWNIQSLTTNYT